LDGNARLNVATFVTTWMEPQAQRLMAECVDKNMIDKDEYPQTAELEARCVAMLSRLWHAPQAAGATGCSTTGASEAATLGGGAAGGAGPQAPLAASAGRRGGAGGAAEPGDGDQCPGVLGEVRQLLGCGDAAGPDGGRPAAVVGRGGGGPLRRGHHRGRGRARLD